MKQYDCTKAFVWRKQPPEPVFRHPVLREAFEGALVQQRRLDTLSGAISFSLAKLARIATFYLGSLVFLPLMALPWLLRGRLRGPMIAAALTLAAILLTIPVQPHYAAALTGVFCLAALQCLRFLWAARRRGNWIGQFLVPAAPLVLVLSMATTTSAPTARPAHIARVQLLKSLAQEGAKQLVIVRYGHPHNAVDEWVYNDADIDRSPVVWARDMGAQNEELVEYFPDRKAWLLSPDAYPARLVPYAAEGTTNRER